MKLDNVLKTNGFSLAEKSVTSQHHAEEYLWRHDDLKNLCKHLFLMREWKGFQLCLLRSVESFKVTFPSLVSLILSQLCAIYCLIFYPKTEVYIIALSKALISHFRLILQSFHRLSFQSVIAAV